MSKRNSVSMETKDIISACQICDLNLDRSESICCESAPHCFFTCDHCTIKNPKSDFSGCVWCPLRGVQQ